MTLFFQRKTAWIYRLAELETEELRFFYIGTEQILLGLIRDGNNLAFRVLIALGIQPDSIRSRLLQILGKPPADKEVSIRYLLTARAERVFEYADQEARDQGWMSIGPEHLLLGLIREGEGPGTSILRKMGRDLDAVRREIARQQFAPEAWRTEMVLDLAQKIREKPNWEKIFGLADALEKAGCNDVDLIRELRTFATNRTLGPLGWFLRRLLKVEPRPYEDRNDIVLVDPRPQIHPRRRWWFW